MPAWSRVYDATLCFVSFSFILASLTVTAAMTTVTAMTEEVHGDEEYKDQDPEPIFQ